MCGSIFEQLAVAHDLAGKNELCLSKQVGGKPSSIHRIYVAGCRDLLCLLQLGFDALSILSRQMRLPILTLFHVPIRRPFDVHFLKLAGTWNREGL